LDVFVNLTQEKDDEHFTWLVFGLLGDLIVGLFDGLNWNEIACPYLIRFCSPVLNQPAILIEQACG
jgi:hypothetical protein